MHENQRVADMADEVLVRQAKVRVEGTGEPFEVALKAVLETEAGRQLRKLHDGPHRGERAFQWQEDLTRGRRQERVRAARDQFMLMEAEQRELEQHRPKGHSGGGGRIRTSAG